MATSFGLDDQTWYYYISVDLDHRDIFVLKLKRMVQRKVFILKVKIILFDFAFK